MMNEKEVVKYVMELFCRLKWALAFKVELDVNKKGVIETSYWLGKQTIRK